MSNNNSPRHGEEKEIETKLKVPCFHPVWLTFEDVSIEQKYKLFLSKEWRGWLPTCAFFVAVGDLLLFFRLLEREEPTLQTSWLLWTHLICALHVFVAAFGNIRRSHLRWAAVSMLLASISVSAIWGELAVSPYTIPPVVFLQFFCVLFGFSWTTCAINIVMLMAVRIFFTGPGASCGVRSAFSLNPFIFPIMTLIPAFFLERNFRRTFAALHHLNETTAQLAERCGMSNVFKCDDSQPVLSALKGLEIIGQAMLRKNEEVEKALQVKERFLATMSHEIRSPLHSVVALSNLLKDSEGFNEEERCMVNTIQSSSEHLLTVVNDILDFTRIHAGKLQLNPEPFRLHSLVESIVCIMAPLIKQGVDLVSHVDTLEDVFLIGDAMRLKQICCNLMSNAAKFTHKGSVGLFVNVTHHPISDDDTAGTAAAAEGEEEDRTKQRTMVSFCVRDTGIGMPQAYMERMYTPFEQSDANIVKNYGGTGLGLVITKQLIDLFQGEIKCESTVDVGTSFTLSIPLSRASQDPQPSICTAVSSLKHQIFVLGDCFSDNLRECIVLWLKQAGATVLSMTDLFRAGRMMLGLDDDASKPADDEEKEEVSDEVLMAERRLVLRPLEFTVVCSEDSEVETMLATCQDVSTGRALVIRNGKLTSAASAVSKSPPPDARRSNQGPGIDSAATPAATEGDGSRTNNSNASVERTQEPSPATPQTASTSSRLVLPARQLSFSSGAKKPWTRMTCDLPLLGSTLLRAATRIVRKRLAVVARTSTGSPSASSPATAGGAGGGGVSWLRGTTGGGGGGGSGSESSPPISPFRRTATAASPKTGERSTPRRAKATRPPPSPVFATTPGSNSTNKRMENSLVNLVVEASSDESGVSRRSLKLDGLVSPQMSQRSAASPAAAAAAAAASPFSSSQQQHHASAATPSSTISRRGSCFSDGEENCHSASSSTAEFEGFRVLVVDDNAINRRVGEQLLRRCGITDIGFAEDGKLAVEAVEKAINEQQGYTCILMDSHMPVMNGVEASKEIMQRWPDATIRPVVVSCTADVFTEKCEAMPLGIMKPFTLAHLKSVLRECVEYAAKLRKEAQEFSPDAEEEEEEVEQAEENEGVIERLDEDEEK